MLFLDNATDRRTLDLVTKSMTQEDIEKSMRKSGLVQVERIVVKPGVKPFQQKFWVKPDQVKKTDIVLSNRGNKHSVSEKSIEETKQFYEDCGDDETFYLMLQDQNVRWVESDDPTENLSRAKRAFAEYLDALNVHDQKVKEQQLQKLKNANPRDTGINFDIQDQQAQEYLKKIQFHLGDAKADGNKSKITSLKESTPEYKQVSKLIADNWKHKLPPDSDMQNPNSHRNGGQLDYEILGIYRVDKFASENDFNKIVQSRDKYKNTTAIGKNCQKDIFFHGTSYKKTGLIMGHSGEFRVPKEEEVDHGNMLGSGIFLADAPSKSAGYLSVIEKPSDGDTGTIMVCEASLGECLVMSGKPDYMGGEIKQFFHENFDTIVASELADGPFALNNNEFCVHDPKAVIPRYLVDIKLSVKYND